MRKKLFDEAREDISRINRNELDELVTDYISNKSLEAKYKDLASSGNSKIKEIMSEQSLSTYSCSAGTVKLSERKSEKFDEEGLIAFLIQSGHPDLVKTKPYIDYDALESAIYHEKISKSDVKKMDEYKIVSVTQVLNISKKKGD